MLVTADSLSHQVAGQLTVSEILCAAYQSRLCCSAYKACAIKAGNFCHIAPWGAPHVSRPNDGHSQVSLRQKACYSCAVELPRRHTPSNKYDGLQTAHLQCATPQKALAETQFQTPRSVSNLRTASAGHKYGLVANTHSVQQPVTFQKVQPPLSKKLPP